MKRGAGACAICRFKKRASRRDSITRTPADRRVSPFSGRRGRGEASDRLESPQKLATRQRGGTRGEGSRDSIKGSPAQTIDERNVLRVTPGHNARRRRAGQSIATKGSRREGISRKRAAPGNPLPEQRESDRAPASSASFFFPEPSRSRCRRHIHSPNGRLIAGRDTDSQSQSSRKNARTLAFPSLFSPPIFLLLSRCTAGLFIVSSHAESALNNAAIESGDAHRSYLTGAISTRTRTALKAESVA